MATSHVAGGDFDLRKLDDFLMSERAPDDCMQLSDLDGFLTAIAIGPELIMPSEWLPVIWGEGEPVFENTEDAQSVIGAIMGRYNEILRQIQDEPDAQGPLFWETPYSQVVAADWAEGFMDGVGLRRQAWWPLLESDEGIELLTPIMAFLHDDDGKPLLEVEPYELVEIRKVAIDLIVPSVRAINSYWKAHRHPTPKASKTGRNDPCPCGSGRKYKRCCGAN